MGGVSGENIVALCDVDDARAGEAYSKFPKARKFNDYRRMLDAIAAAGGGDEAVMAAFTANKQDLARVGGN